MKSVSAGGGPYVLQHASVRRSGDSGPMLISLKFNEDATKLEPCGENGEVHVGCVVRCGSINGRSYSAQDWWQTSLIQEILSVEDKDGQRKIRVKTLNSIYEITGNLT